MAKKKKNKVKGILVIEVPVPVRDEREDIRITMFNKMISKTNNKQLDTVLDMAKEIANEVKEEPLGYQEMIKTLLQQSAKIK